MLDRLVPTVPAELGLAHDLRNLLQTATAALSIIDRGTNGRSQHVEDAIAGARTSIEQASALAIRTFEQCLKARDADGTADVRKALLEAAQILRFARPSAVTLDVQIDEGTGSARCDPLALQNAILNLAFNAFDAVAAEGRVSLQAQPGQERSTVEIRVTDNGVGMSPETVERAFDPFFTTKCEGLGGVGLATVDDFVSRSGGEIAIESELGTGTSIRLLLPAA